MNFLKLIIVKPRIKKEVHNKVLQIIKEANQTPETLDKHTLKEFEDHLVKTNIALIDMSSYPLYERFIDAIRLGYFTWVENQRAKAEYHKQLKDWGYRF